jgi:hypothetical protein
MAQVLYFIDYQNLILLYILFWVIPRRLNFKCQRFGTLCLYKLQKRAGTYPPMKDGTDRVFRNVGIYSSDFGESPEWSIQHSNHGESLKPKNLIWLSLIQTSDWVMEKTGQIRLGKVTCRGVRVCISYSELSSSPISLRTERWWLGFRNLQHSRTSVPAERLAQVPVFSRVVLTL